MEFFFKRLEAYIKVRPTAAMVDIIVKIMVEVISILGIVTKDIRRGRTSMSFPVYIYLKFDHSAAKYLKKLLGMKDIEEALQRLDKFTQEEARMAATEALTITRGIGDKVNDMDERLEGVDGKVQSVDAKVEGIDEKVLGVDSKVQGVKEKVLSIDSRVLGVYQRVLSVDSKVQGVDDKLLRVDRNVQRVDDKVQSVENKVLGVDHKVSSVIEGELYCSNPSPNLPSTFARLGVKETGVAFQQVVNQVSNLNRS
jgi:archaellum component FlaC